MYKISIVIVHKLVMRVYKYIYIYIYFYFCPSLGLEIPFACSLNQRTSPLGYLATLYQIQWIVFITYTM